MLVKYEKVDDMSIKDIDSGTLIRYGDRTQTDDYGYAIVEKGVDGDCVLFDIEDNMFYADVENYTILHIYDAEIVIK